MIAHNSTNIIEQSICLIILMAAIYGFRLWTQDVSQAYLQSSSTLTHDVYVTSKGDIKSKHGGLLKLLEPL